MKFIILSRFNIAFFFSAFPLAGAEGRGAVCPTGKQAGRYWAVGITVYQGFSVALSSDGNTAIIGGYGDNYQAGAAWVYTRSGGVWTQQGSKLVSTSAFQGASVALSSDGNTAIVGAFEDSPVGAAWLYTRSGGV